MKTNDFTAEGINERNPASVKALNFLLTPFYMVDDLLAYLGRVIRCALVAWLFETDMNSAGVLLWKYYQHVVWVTDDEEESEAEALEDDDEEQDETQEIIHPPLDPNFVKATAPTIELDSHALPLLVNNDEEEIIDRAADVIIDFLHMIFEEEGTMNADGVLAKGVVAPWAKRGNLPGPVKEMAKKIIEYEDEPIFFVNVSKLWQFNIKEYPTLEATTSIVRGICQFI